MSRLPAKDFAHIEDRRVQTDGVTRCVQSIRCSMEGCTETLDFTSTGSKRRPPSQLAKMAHVRGWQADMRKGQHVCPKHERDPMPKQDYTPGARQAQPKRPSEAPPPEMTMTDRRAIFREIDDHYDEANGRYVPDATDDSLAGRLKMPRAWVTKVREENFGPAGPSREVLELERKIGAAEAQQKALDDKIMELMAHSEKLGKTVSGLRSELEEVKT